LGEALRMCVCVCVCVCTYVCTYVYVCMYVCMCVCVSAWRYICLGFMDETDLGAKSYKEGNTMWLDGG
jgi:hypothetical protein